MRDQGLGPKEISFAAINEGLDFVENLNMLRCVFNLDLVHAKEAWVQAKGFATSLDEYQENIIPEIEQVLSELEKDTE